MKKEELEQKFKDIGQLEDPAQMRTMLTDLLNEVSTDYDDFITAAKERDDYKKDNETLRSANMKLFLQVGSKDKVDTTPSTGENKASEELKYEDLFNDEGGLK